MIAIPAVSDLMATSASRLLNRPRPARAPALERCQPPMTSHTLRRISGVWRALCLFALLALTPTLAPAAEPAAAGAEVFPNADCLDCHNDPSNTRTVNGKAVPLELFTTNRFDQSVHAKLNCVDCHVGIKDLVHESKLPPPNCLNCHEPNESHQKAAAQYANSIHGVSHTLGASGAASCWDCHGSHNILSVTNDHSPVFKLNLPRTCASCHSNEGLTREYQMKHPEAASHYMDSIHGQKLLKQGLIVAPSCNDCHGVHDIKRAVDRDSPINSANVAKTCGKCHYKIEETYMSSVHGQLLAKGDKRGPVCTDCHSAHQIQRADTTTWRLDTVAECGTCHADKIKTYRDTFQALVKYAAPVWQQLTDTS